MNKKTINIILCILWMMVIFYFSAQPADNSQEMSESLLQILFSLLHIKQLPSYMIMIANFLIRKGAHLSEYAILAILLKRVAGNHARSSLFVLAFCALYASSDEFHQLFVEGRSAQFMDVMIDSFGAVLGILVMKIVSLWNKKRMV